MTKNLDHDGVPSTDLPVADTYILLNDQMVTALMTGTAIAADGQDDVIAALSAMTPADMNIDVMLDHLTASSDLFSSPHLDLSALASSLGGDDHG